MILVTGGAGFIGSHIVEHLVHLGRPVRVLDDFSTGSRENLIHLASEIELIEGDLRDRRTVARALQGIRHVLHQGALPSVPLSIEKPLRTHACNVEGTLNLLQAARDAGVRRLVFASSSSVYGDTPTLPKVETMPPDPLSPYALQKWIGERYCQLYGRLYGLETVVLRYFNVFGPRQNLNSAYAAVIPNFIRALLKGEAPVIYGDGRQTRDFTYVANVVEANLAALEAENAAGRVINVASHRATSVNDLFRIVREIVGTSVDPRYLPPRPGDVKHSLADITQASTLLGYRCRVSLEEGLQRTVAWYRQRLAAAPRSGGER